ncbi:MAG: ATP-binding cassette domain-containing protein [Candidatus Wallbacteria bacterium]|nr:ATP-binding cassette domain-containing protein [Candidatus Wallbacteria bacterium]
MLRVSGLTSSLSDFSLAVDELEIQGSTYFVLMGPSGAGKTLLCECLTGFRAMDAGRVELYQREITCLKPEERGISLVHQEHCLFRHLDVFENVAYGLRCRRVSQAEINRTVNGILEKIGIPQLARRRMEELSGGERQRVALARAVAVKPKLLIMDEPLNSLDIMSKRGMMDLLLSLKSEFNHVTLHVSHDLEEALYLGDRIGLLLNGKLVQTGETGAVVLKPATIEAAQFFGIENIYRVTGKGGGGVALSEGFAFLVDFPDRNFKYCCIHSELPRLYREQSTDGSRYPGTVKAIRKSGKQWIVKIDLGMELTVRLYHDPAEYCSGKVFVQFPDEAIHFI